MMPRQFTFKKSARMLSKAHFSRLFTQGKKIDASGFSLLVASRKDETPKFGIVTGKKWGSAVTRNRLKRQLKECLRHCIPHFDPQYDYVLMPRKHLPHLSFSDCLQTMLRTATQLKGTCQ